MARGLRDEAAGQAGAAAPDAAEPLVDLDFKRGAGVDGVACVRPTPGYVEDGRGVWRLVPPDTPRVSDCGLLIEEARTNWIRNNAMAGATEGTPGDLPTRPLDPVLQLAALELLEVQGRRMLHDENAGKVAVEL